MKPPDCEKTDRIAVGFVLVASIVSRPAFHLAFVILTRSAGAGAPWVSVSVAVRVTPNQVAVMVAVVVVVTAEVVTANAPLAVPPLTTAFAGTCTRAGLLLESSTIDPSVAPVKATVPVAELPPVSVDGRTDTVDSVGPGGGAALTDRFAVRGTFWIAAVIWTMLGAAAALVEIVKVTASWPGAATTEAGTVATDGSLLNNSTVVALESGISVTVPCEDAPPRTESGNSDNDEMMPAAEATLATPNIPAIVHNVAITTTKRRMAPPEDLGRTRTGTPIELRTRRGNGSNPPHGVHPKSMSPTRRGYHAHQPDHPTRARTMTNAPRSGPLMAADPTRGQVATTRTVQVVGRYDSRPCT
jgi:hypothetical protein